MQTKQCNACGQTFEAARKDKIYCSDNCRKKASRNKARKEGDRKFEYMRRREYLRCRIKDLEEMIYGVPPHLRLGQMKYIFDHLHLDSDLRTIVTDPELLRRPRRADMRQSIAQCANIYSKMFFGLSIKKYVTKLRADEQIDEVPITWRQRKPQTKHLRAAQDERKLLSNFEKPAYVAGLCNFGPIRMELVRLVDAAAA